MIFRFVYRNLLRQGSHTMLNIAGLSVGMGCAVTMAAWISNELSYDRHLPGSDRIYRLTFETTTGGNTIHFARCWESWVSKIPDKFPQVEQLVRLAPYRHTAVKAGENKLYSDRVFTTDSNFFRVFNLEMIRGNAEKALSEPYAVVITSSLSHRLFGDSDPLGRTILMSGEYDEKMTLFTVRGVMKDAPENSHAHFDILASFVNPAEPPGWAYVYLMLRKGADPRDILKMLPDFIKEVEPASQQIKFEPYLQKITDIHLRSDKDREIEPNGNISNIYLYLFTALILLLVSWTNYYNLNKARLLILRKQSVILRINGASLISILKLPVMESALCTAAAFIIAFSLLDLFREAASAYFGITLFPGGFNALVSIWPVILILFLLSTLAGSLPVIIDILLRQTSLNPAEAIRRNNLPGRSTYGFLLAVQFFLATGLIVAAITINRQKELILSTKTERTGSAVLVFEKQNWQVRLKYREFRDRALQNPLIRDVTASLEEPTGETLDAMGVESSALKPEYKDRALFVLSVDDNFLSFMNIPLVAGSNFRKYDPDLKGEDYILNETAVRELGWTPEEAIGKPFRITFSTPDIFYGGTVVGVAKDFHFNTLKQEIKPYVLFQKPIFYLCFMVEIDSLHRDEAISHLKMVWEEILPDYLFQFGYIDTLFEDAYRKEFTQSRLTGLFSLLAIVIICLGLYSVTSMLVSRRTKELGIRKVMGAGVFRVVFMLVSEYSLWFAGAFVAACPAAWLIMDKWLQNFVYRVELEWWYFAVAGIAVFLVSFATVFFRSLAAATRNPVEALRYE